MANAPISGLPVASTMGDNDLLLLEQNNTAKKMTGEDLKQYFNANVVAAAANPVSPTTSPSATYDPNTNTLTLNLPEADYVVSCTKTGTSGLVDTWTLTTALGGTFSFQVTNGANGTGAPGTATPKKDSGSGVVGTSTNFSREDHQHPMPSASDVGALALLGNQNNINPVADLNDFITGIGLFCNDTQYVTTANFPYSESESKWAMIVATGDDSGTNVQVAFDLNTTIQPRIRKRAAGTWSSWSSLKSSATALNGIVPIGNGGTGADNASDALTNLGITPANIGAMPSDGLLVDSVSIGSVTTSNSYKEVTKSAAKTGYTPIAIAGWNMGNTYIFCSRLYLSGSNIVATFRNNTGSESTFSPTVYVLYQKN